MQRFYSSSLMIVVFCAWTVASCKKSDADVRIRVEVKTNQGDPVDKAQILLDGKVLGETSISGQLQTELTLPAGARKRLEVKKESDKYYFAPYFESFVVSDASRQEINVPAVLYFVPKPAPATTNAAAGAAAGIVAAATTPTDPVDAAKTDDGAQPVAEAPTPSADRSSEASVGPTPSEDIAATVVDAASESTQSDAAHGDAARPDTVHPGTVQPTPAPVVTPAELAAADAGAPALPDENAVAADENAVAVDPEPKSAEVALTGVDGNEPPAATGKDLVYPKPERSNDGQTVYTVHVLTGEKPIADAQVYLGDEAEGDLKLGCTTNARGRCVVRFADKPQAPVTFVATRKGYKTGKVAARVTHQGNLRIPLEAGQTIDVYAITKTYNFTSGLKGVEVYIGGKLVGTTDSFGHYAYVYTGKSDDLVPIALKPKSHLPETYETDFVASGPMTLVRYFSPSQPPPVRMAVVGLKPAGKVSPQVAAKLGGADRNVLEAARQHLFASAAFKEFQTALFERLAARAGRTTADALLKGWQDTELKAAVDAVLVPTLALGGNKASLELSVIDSRGRVLAAAVESLNDVDDKASIGHAVAQIAKKIVRTFPFEGAVLSKEADKAVINIGYSSGRGLKAGDILDVSGMQSEKFGRSQTHRRIASLVVREVSDASAKCAVENMVPRATIERGDLVALRPRRLAEPGSGVQMRVVAAGDKGSARPVAQANVYLNDAWIGATDGDGRLDADLSGSGQLKVIKHGYAALTRQVELKPGAKLDLSLARESVFVRIDSKPAGVVVSIDGKAIGKTPLKTPVAVPAGFVKLTLAAPTGYKPFAAVMELDQGALELTGANAVILERDERSEAQRLLAAGKAEEAVARYEAIPKEHSDWLVAQHELGEIYLTQLDQPARAAEAFGRVTAEPAVKEFTDKRFIGSHIDEAIAIFLTGERLAAENKEAAIAHYKRAIEILDGVVPYLRFVKSDQYAQAVHNVDFHRALARHRLWQSSQDPVMLTDTVRTWRAYLDGSARSVPAEGVSKTYLENARVYFKQATASQKPAAEVVR